MANITGKKKCASFYIPYVHHTFNNEYLISIFNKKQPLGKGQIKNIEFVDRNDTFEYKSAFVHFMAAPKRASSAFNTGGIKVYYNSCEYFRILPNNRYLATKTQNITWHTVQDFNEHEHEYEDVNKHEDVNKKIFTVDSLKDRIETLECLISDLQIENAALNEKVSQMKKENVFTVKKLSNINYQIQEKHDYENMDSITSWDRQKNTDDEDYADTYEEPDVENQVHNLPDYKETIPTTKYVLTNKKYYSY